MKKNDVYLEILQVALPHIRNGTTWRLFYRIKDRSCFYESQLIHSFYILLASEDFNESDMWFLNHHARSYYEECDSSKSMLYNAQVKSISKLFLLVPENLKDTLEWRGPVEQ
ncbi:hypothetical protein [Serratia plymuthica]|uniref:hypothetical protein n=1 Tax=Serratia plymuthica TaxID=82996 RepID=UPI0020C86F25|nr:hypothetical protein [Serratia plymuthica]UTN95540.1 hypothetical protein NLX81_19025 [Serratia plymuthica]